MKTLSGGPNSFRLKSAGSFHPIRFSHFEKIKNQKLFFTTSTSQSPPNLIKLTTLKSKNSTTTTTEKKDGRREATLYVKGFLQNGENELHFNRWLLQHDIISKSPGSTWSSETVYGYRWENGKMPLHFRLPVPHVTLAQTFIKYLSVSRRSGSLLINPLSILSPTFLLTSAAQDLALLTANLYYEFTRALENATTRAEALAETLHHLKREHDYVRVVSHSIGSLHALQAAALMRDSERPDAMHLCAPACTEAEVEAVLKRGPTATATTHIYFSKSDYLLSYMYKIQNLGRGGGSAIGSHGLKEKYPYVLATDVSNHFDLFVHTQYSDRFYRFVGSETINNVQK